jgi:hypothetical protein
MTASVSRTTPSQSHTEAGTLRKRAQRACSQCHAHKTKCSGDLPRCKRCESANLACEYHPAKRKFASVPSAQSQPHEHPNAPVTPTMPPSSTESPPSSSRHSSEPLNGSSIKSGDTASPTTCTSIGSASGSANGSSILALGSDTMPCEATMRQPSTSGNFPLTTNLALLTAEDLLIRKDLIFRHMDAFYDNLYWLPSLGVFHPATTHQQIQDGTFHPAQAAAVCAISSFFVSPTEAGREFGRTCANQVEFHIYRNCHKFDERVLGAFVLNSLYNLLSGCYAKVWHCSGMATRLMLGLQINWEGSSDSRSFIQQETIRRIAWQIFNLDRLLAGGFDEYISCRSELMKIRLPCNEHAFRDNIELKVERLYDKPTGSRNALGMHAHQIRLVDLRHRIHVATRNLSELTDSGHLKLEKSKIMANIRTLQTDLTRIKTSLPDDLRLSDQNISRYVAAQERPGFVFLHAHLLACHIDLYRFALPGMLDKAQAEVFLKLPQDFLIKSQKQAVAHALCLARFCDAVLKEFRKQPRTGRIQFAADCTIPFTVTQCLRVLLVALQYNLFHDLSEYTSAPSWRNEPADEASIHNLIDSLLAIEEPYCQIFDLAAKVHESNMAMVAEFDRTRQLVRGEGYMKLVNTAEPDDVAAHTGPPFVLENSRAAAREEERRLAATEVEAVAQWFGTLPEAAEHRPAPFLVPQMQFQSFGPPGIPMFLEEARGGPTGMNDKKASLYDRTASELEVSPKPWTVPELSAMLGGNAHLIEDDTMAVGPLNGAGNGVADPVVFPFSSASMAPPIMQLHSNLFTDHGQGSNGTVMPQQSHLHMPPHQAAPMYTQHQQHQQYMHQMGLSNGLG